MQNLHDCQGITKKFPFRNNLCHLALTHLMHKCTKEDKRLLFKYPFFNLSAHTNIVLCANCPLAFSLSSVDIHYSSGINGNRKVDKN